MFTDGDLVAAEWLLAATNMGPFPPWSARPT
jgi:hypothetical protein